MYGTEHAHLQMRKLLVEFVKSNRQMFEPLVIRETFDKHIERMTCAQVWGSHIELQAAASLFEMPVFICTTGNASQFEQGYKWTCYNLFPPGKLKFPPPQERPKTLDLLSHIELWHTGGCHFDCVLSKDLKCSLIQPKLHVMHLYHHTILYDSFTVYIVTHLAQSFVVPD